MTTAARLSITLAACVITAAASADPIVPLSYTNSPTWQYGDSGNELTDGAWSTTGINPADLWMGWSSAHAVITFDLGAGAPAVGAATIVFCDWTGAAVYLPESVEFQFSNDADFGAGNYTSQTFLTPYDGHAGAETVIRPYEMDLAYLCRYVRIYADSQFSWLFIGEISFATPTPGAAALLGLAALGANRRRRA